jgi:hypothetical protein
MTYTYIVSIENEDSLFTNNILIHTRVFLTYITHLLYLIFTKLN